MSNVIYSSKKITDAEQAVGAIVYSKTAHDNDVLTWIDTEKNIVTQSQFKILKALKCEPDEVALPKMDCHHDIVSAAIQHIKKVENTIGGQLGKKNGARYRAYMRLTRHIEAYKDTLFVTEELKRSVEDIYHFPLREYARETINRQLKMGITDEELGSLIVSLRDEGKLSINDEEEIVHREPTILCSMGITDSE